MQFIASRATPVSAPLPSSAADQWIDYGLDMRCCLLGLATSAARHQPPPLTPVETACTEKFMFISREAVIPVLGVGTDTSIVA